MKGVVVVTLSQACPLRHCKSDPVEGNLLLDFSWSSYIFKVSAMTKYIISTPGAPKALGAYSQGIKQGDLVVTSGQIGIDPTTMKLVEGIEQQIRQTFANLAAICEAGGASLNDIVKLTVFLIDKNAWPLVNHVMTELFAGQFPARTAVGVTWLPLDAEVEIEAIVRLKSN